jgi:hypothetical protein
MGEVPHGVRERVEMVDQLVFVRHGKRVGEKGGSVDGALPDSGLTGKPE